MDAEYLLGSLLRGVLTSRGHRKRVTRATRFLLGNRRVAGAGALALGGLAYGLFESLTQSPGNVVPPPIPPAAPPGASASTPVPPPLPPRASGSSGAMRSTNASGTPASGVAAAAQSAGPSAQTERGDSVSPAVLRVIRLSLSAARADGELTTTEADVILAQARAVGAEALIARDLQQPQEVEALLEAVADQRQREQLYTVAFAIVRADENLTEAERAYLKRVARAMHIDDELVARLETDAASGMGSGSTT